MADWWLSFTGHILNSGTRGVGANSGEFAQSARGRAKSARTVCANSRAANFAINSARIRADWYVREFALVRANSRIYTWTVPVLGSGQERLLN